MPASLFYTNIRNKLVQMERWQKEALLRHRMAILDDLHVDYVLDHLLANQVLYEEHKESIFAQSGRRNKARHLLDLLPSLGPSAYSEFIASLREPYHWLADILSKESRNTATNVGVPTSQFSSNNAVHKQHQMVMTSEEICHLLSTLSSVSSACGTSLCVIGDSLAALVQTMKIIENVPTSDINVARENSINVSMGEQQSGIVNRDVNMVRLRGGGNLDIQDIEENKRVTAEIGLGNECIVNSVYKNEVLQGVHVVDTVKDHLANEVDIIDGGFPSIMSIAEQGKSNVKSLEGVLVEGFMTSPVEEVILKDSPDSGIMRDMHLKQVQEGITSLSITSQNGMNSFGETSEVTKAISMDQINEKSDGYLISSSSSSSCVIGKSNPDLYLKELTPLLAEIETLRHALTDITVALKSVVQVSDKKLKIVNSI